MTSNGCVDRDEVSIALSPAQVSAVVRQASQTNSVAATLAGLVTTSTLREALNDTVEDRVLSRSLLLGLLILASFPASGEARTLAAVADEHPISTTSVHRYALTLVRAGLLERDPERRTYRRPTDPAPSA